MRDTANIDQLIQLRPDYMGFIFYEKSKRFAGDALNPEVLKRLGEITAVAVTVNSDFEQLLSLNKKYGFTTFQLHGTETPDFCAQVKSHGFKVIKAFQVDNRFDFDSLTDFQPFCDYYLFDNKSDNFGGTGLKFDWEILKRYKNQKGIFLSGGIGSDNVQIIRSLDWLNVHAVDINSCFETQPALKDIALIREFIHGLNK